MKDFEREIINELLSGVESEAIEFSDQVAEGEVTYSGAGYFLTLKDPALSEVRAVLNKPDIRGQLDGIDVGYLAFIENHKFTLECYSYDQEISEVNRENGFQRAKT
ncbi:Uncharacterised protein [BD1-7 clade bacterium]|nr:Uncharacterised protein [BD1-7 clade bacterium]